MTTHHRGTGHTAEDGGLNPHVVDTGGMDKGPDNGNEITTNSDTMLAFGGSEVDGHLSDPFTAARLI